MARRKSKAARASDQRGHGKVSKRAKGAGRRAASKQAACLALLERDEGATIADLQKITGWKAHSIRGFLAGAVKKKLRLAITSRKEERGRVYRVAPKNSSR